MFPKRPHLLAALDGPLAVEGGDSGADRVAAGSRSCCRARTNQRLFAIAPLPPESEQIDLLDVFDDCATTAGQTGAARRRPRSRRLADAPGAASRFGGPPAHRRSRAIVRRTASPIDHTTLEVVNLLLGAGADASRSPAPLVPGPDARPASRRRPRRPHHRARRRRRRHDHRHRRRRPRLAARRLRRHVAGRRLVRRQPGRVLVRRLRLEAVRRTRSATRRRSAFPSRRRSRRRRRHHRRLGVGRPGWTVGIIAYGGAGNDTIVGSQAGDFLAGGSGDDTIAGAAAIDLIYGDSGVNVDVRTRDADDPDRQRQPARTPTGSRRGARHAAPARAATT